MWPWYTRPFNFNEIEGRHHKWFSLAHATLALDKRLLNFIAFRSFFIKQLPGQVRRLIMVGCFPLWLLSFIVLTVLYTLKVQNMMRLQKRFYTDLLWTRLAIFRRTRRVCTANSRIVVLGPAKSCDFRSAINVGNMVILSFAFFSLSCFFSLPPVVLLIIFPIHTNLSLYCIFFSKISVVRFGSNLCHTASLGLHAVIDKTLVSMSKSNKCFVFRKGRIFCSGVRERELAPLCIYPICLANVVMLVLLVVA